MAALDDYEVLGALVAADEAAQEPEVFVLIYTGGMGGPEIVGHPGWPDDAAAPSDVRVDEFEDLGWVRVTKRDGKQRHFAVTGEGRRAWQEHVARSSHVPGRVNLEWPAPRTLLERIYETYLDQGAPEKGIDVLPLTEDPETGRETDAMVRELIRAGFLDVTFRSAAGPRGVRPSPLTFQMLGHWPAGPAQDALNELVVALNAEIDRTSDTQKRSKLIQVRDGLLGVARDIAIAYLEKKIGA